MYPCVFSFNLSILLVFSLVKSEMSLSHAVHVVRLQSIASWEGKLHKSKFSAFPFFFFLFFFKQDGDKIPLQVKQESTPTKSLK